MKRLSLYAVVAIVLVAPPVLRAKRPDSAASSVAASGKSGEPSRLEELYQERAARNPQDVEAFEGMAILQVRRGDYAQAINSYRRVLELAPDNHDAKVGLGRALAFAGEYEAALRSFQVLLQEHPGDTDALEGQARVQMWAGHPEVALPLFRDLAAHYPANPEYAVGVARGQMNLHQYTEARHTLTALLAAHPHHRDAQLQMAYLDLFQGHQTEALRRFNNLIREDPTDAEALQGNARIAYYRGDLKYARDLTARLVDDDPTDAAALLLLAQIARAMHDRQRARALLQRAETLDPRNPEARDLANSLRDDLRPTLHTSTSFAREIGTGSAAISEELSAFGNETTWGYYALPRSESYVSLSYLPSQSPGAGTQGAVSPSELSYHQVTYLTPQLTVRSGVGLARFGSGAITGIPIQDQSIASAGVRPLGFVSFSYALSPKLAVDLTAGRSAITYTPTAVLLGVMEDRVSIGLDYHFDRSTDLRFEPFVTDDSTIKYSHSLDPGAPQADNNGEQGASIIFNRRLFRKSTVSADVGYAGLVFGIGGTIQQPYLGLFNPTFYQRHYLTTHFAGKIRGPLGYDITLDGGVQQVMQSEPFKPALLLSPGFTFKASPRLSATLCYTHYDNSQSLGTLRGNAVRLSTDWRF